MGIIIQLVASMIKLAVVLFWKSGIWAFFGWLTIFEFTIAKLMPKALYDGIGGAVFGWGLGLVIWGLVLLNNIVKFASKDPQFSLFKLLAGGRRSIGTVAKVNLASMKDLSGFFFGGLNGKYVTKKETEDGHILVVGGAGSGKSSCVAIPSLMSWKERVFAIDIKGELYQKTKSRRDESKIKVFNPTDPNAFGYDPFYMLKYSDEKVPEAKAIATSLIPLPMETKDPHWIQSAQNFLTGAILYYQNKGCNFSETMFNIQSKNTRELISEIMISDNIEAKLFMNTFDTMEDKELGSVISTMSNYIITFASDKNLQRALSGKGKTITPQDLENGFDIFCCIPEHKLNQWKDLFGMMVNQFLTSFERREETRKKPILFLIDEFPRLGKIEAITNGLATLRSKGIHIALFVQSKSQLNAIYGNDVAEVIADNCPYKAILKASTPTTQEWCSKLVGTYDKLKIGKGKQMDIIGIGKGLGINESTENAPIIKPEEFGFLDDIVCIFPTGYYRLKKVSCYEDKNFLVS